MGCNIVNIINLKLIVNVYFIYMYYWWVLLKKIVYKYLVSLKGSVF